MPLQKVHHLVLACRALSESSGDATNPDAKPLSADDLLPVFISLLRSLSLQRLFSLSRLLTHTGLRTGEGAYWTATLEAASEFLREEGGKKEEKAKVDDKDRLEGMLASSGFIG